MKGSLIRSFALAGATLISAAIIVGPLAKLTKYNFVGHRRTLGVWGFTFIIMHMVTVMAFFFNFDFSALFWTFNPYENPLLFGLAAFIMFVPLYLTSTDWAVSRLGFKRWKGLHRLIYVIYIFSILHYLQINPELLYNPAGYLLLAATVLALALQTAAFAKMAAKTKNKKAIITGLAIIILGAVLFLIAYTGFLKP